MKKNRNDYELLLETLSRMQEEKASANLQVESLRKEMEVMRESYTQELAVMRESHARELATLRESLSESSECMRQTISDLIRKLDDREHTIAELTKQLVNAQAEGKLRRKRRFAPTSE